MMAFRLKSTALDSTIIPLSVNSGQTAAAGVYELTLLLNPSGSLPWLWQDIPNSILQFATGSSTAYAIADEGTKVFSAINAGATSTNTITYDPTFALGSDLDGNQDILVVGWKSWNGTPANCSTSLIWREV